jgi:hypothetical protein
MLQKSEMKGKKTLIRDKSSINHCQVSHQEKRNAVTLLGT